MITSSGACGGLGCSAWDASRVIDHCIVDRPPLPSILSEDCPTSLVCLTLRPNARTVRIANCLRRRIYLEERYLSISECHQSCSRHSPGTTSRQYPNSHHEPRKNSSDSKVRQSGVPVLCRGTFIRSTSRFLPTSCSTRLTSIGFKLWQMYRSRL